MAFDENMTDDTTAESEAELRERIERLEAENERKDERIEALEAEHTEYRARNELDKAEIRQDLHGQIEDRSAEDENTGLEDIWLCGQPIGKLINGLIEGRQTDENDGSDEPDDRRSSLAQLIDLPAEKAKEILSENQERGRSVAQRARELGTNTQAGLVVRSKDVARHLKERGENAHDETVSRVMNFVDELGETDVDAKIHKGKRILVFNPDRVAEYGTGEEPDVIHSHRDVIWSREGGPAKATV